VKTFQAQCRIDTPVEVDYYRNGGILHVDGARAGGRAGPDPLDPDIKRERPLNPVFTVRPDGVSVSLGGWSERRFGLAAACPPAPNGCYDYAAIGAYAAELKAMVPNEVVATFRVDGAVPLQAVVTLIDAVGGVDCRISRALAGERVPDECLFWQAIVNLDPPLRLADVAAP
jgi:hypothetical protein